MAKTKIKKDDLGLYAICGGYISRPFYGTCFQEGDEVKTHHFGGSTKAGVTSLDKPETHNFKRNGQYEVWSTTGMDSVSYKKKNFEPGFENLFGSSYSTFEEYLKLQSDWYKRQSGHLMQIYTDLNLKFKK